MPYPYEVHDSVHVFLTKRFYYFFPKVKGKELLFEKCNNNTLSNYIVQCEVNQKEKNKYHILMHIYYISLHGK